VKPIRFSGTSFPPLGALFSFWTSSHFSPDIKSSSSGVHLAVNTRQQTMIPVVQYRSETVCREYRSHLDPRRTRPGRYDRLRRRLATLKICRSLFKSVNPFRRQTRSKRKPRYRFAGAASLCGESHMQSSSYAGIDRMISWTCEAYWYNAAYSQMLEGWLLGQFLSVSSNSVASSASSRSPTLRKSNFFPQFVSYEVRISASSTSRHSINLLP